ncbi:putative YfiH/PgeF-like polyphenol oxidase family protein [Candidatus Hepatincolaceae symbiont of Richtersius coronifer]
MFISKLLSSVDFIEHTFFGRHLYPVLSNSPLPSPNQKVLRGSSKGYFSSLNVGFKIGDLIKNVNFNRALIAGQFNVSPSKLFTLSQVHSDIIVDMDNNNFADIPFDLTYLKLNDKNKLSQVFPFKVQVTLANNPLPGILAQQLVRSIKADGMMTNKNGIILGVLSADCSPILLVDVNNKRIAAVHCGSQGALKQLPCKAIAALKAKANRPPKILASIGPCIQAISYEVCGEFYEKFIAQDKGSKSFFTFKEKIHQSPFLEQTKFLFNLPSYISYQLKLSGLTAENIEIMPYDTCVEEDKFFSHRRSVKKQEKQRGLQISCIKLKI